MLIGMGVGKNILESSSGDSLSVQVGSVSTQNWKV